jgi:hypothetical protein
MAKTKKPPKDPNQAAKKLIDFLDEKTSSDNQPTNPPKKKNKTKEDTSNKKAKG